MYEIDEGRGKLSEEIQHIDNNINNIEINGEQQNGNTNNNTNIIGKKEGHISISVIIPSDSSPRIPDQLSPKGSPREEKQRKDDEIRVLHKLIEQKRLEKVKRESIGRSRSRTEEEVLLDAIQTLQLDNEIRKAEKKEEALVLMRDAEERAETGGNEVNEILESGNVTDVALPPSPELIEEARREGMPFKPTHTRSNFSLLPTSIQRAPLSIAIPAMLSKSITSPPLPPKNDQSPPRSPQYLTPPSGLSGRPPSIIIPTTPTRSPLASPSFSSSPSSSSSNSPTTPPSPAPTQVSSAPSTPSVSSTPLDTPTPITPSVSFPSSYLHPTTPIAAHGLPALPLLPAPLFPPHALRAKHQKPNPVIELPQPNQEEVEPVKTAVELLKEQLAAIEASIAQREARIKNQEREIEQLQKISKKHPPSTLAKHLEICVAFDISVSWVDKFVESVTDLLDELKTLYEYKINFSLVECGGSGRHIDFQSIEDTTKLQEWLSNVKRCKKETVDLEDYCSTMSRVASLSWADPKWTRVILFFSGSTKAMGALNEDEKLHEVLPQIKALQVNLYFIRLLGKGEIPPFEKYLRHYSDLEKGLLMTEVRDRPTIIHDLVKKAMSRTQKRENTLHAPPEQLVHRLMTWEIIDPTVIPGDHARTQLRRVFCKRYNFPFCSFTDLVQTLTRPSWNTRDANGNLSPAPPLESIRVPAKFEVYALSDNDNCTTRHMEMKNFRKQEVKFAVRQLKTKDENGQIVPAEDCYYFSVLDMQQTALYFAIEFNAHMNVFFPGISPLLFPETFVVEAPQNVPGSNIFMAEQNFPKYNVVRALTPERDAYVQAFSHFTYCVSAGLILIDSLCWIQESNMYTKYAIHAPTLKGRFDLPSNEGEDGIAKFFDKHLCNDMCSTLKLKPHERQSRTRRSLAPDFAQRLVPKPPASPSASTTNLLASKPVRLDKVSSGGSFRSSGNLLSSSSSSNIIGGIGSQYYIFTWQVDMVMGLALDKLFAAGGGTWEQCTDVPPTNITTLSTGRPQQTNGKSPNSKRNKNNSDIPTSPTESTAKSPGLFSQVTKFFNKPPEAPPSPPFAHPYQQAYKQQIQDYHEEQQRQIQELQQEQAELRKKQKKGRGGVKERGKDSPPHSPQKKAPSSPLSSPLSSRSSSPSSLAPFLLDPSAPLPLPLPSSEEKKVSRHSRSYEHTSAQSLQLSSSASFSLLSSPSSLSPPDPFGSTPIPSFSHFRTLTTSHDPSISPPQEDSSLSSSLSSSPSSTSTSAFMRAASPSAFPMTPQLPSLLSPSPPSSPSLSSSSSSLSSSSPLPSSLSSSSVSPQPSTDIHQP